MGQDIGPLLGQTIQATSVSIRDKPLDRPHTFATMGLMNAITKTAILSPVGALLLSTGCRRRT
jgi:hypothetical protein